MRMIYAVILWASALPALAEEMPLIIDVPAIAHASQEKVEQLLGKAEFCRKSRQGISCRFAAHGTEIVFVQDKAERITINDLDDVSYDKAVITRFGLKNQEPEVSTEETISWGNITGIAAVSLFPDKDKIDYALIAVSPLPENKK